MKVKITEDGFVQEVVQRPLNSKHVSLNIVIQQKVRESTRRWKLRNRVATQVVIMNLIACVAKKQRLFYSRQKDSRVDTVYNERKLNAYDIIQAVDELEELGYVRNYVADRQYGASSDKVSSWITATPEFEERFCKVAEAVAQAEDFHLAANPNIELRDSNKKPINYITTAEIEEADRVVAALNKMNMQHTFLNHDGENVVNIYGRVFNENFGMGGRYYKAGVLAIKNKTTKDRLRMTIDGEPVYEVDLDCLHINILADELGIKSSYEGDIYYKVLEPGQCNLTNRKLVKYGVNVCLNARSVQAAAGTIQHFMDESPEGTYCFKDGFEVIRKIKAKLPHFRKAFCNKESSGRRLQNIDSWIAHYVLAEFVEAQCPILVIHDSFIVQRKSVDMLVEAMSRAYQRVVQVDRVVSMKLNWVEDGAVQEADCSR